MAVKEKLMLTRKFIYSNIFIFPMITMFFSLQTTLAGKVIALLPAVMTILITFAQILSEMLKNKVSKLIFKDLKLIFFLLTCLVFLGYTIFESEKGLAALSRLILLLYAFSILFFVKRFKTDSSKNYSIETLFVGLTFLINLNFCLFVMGITNDLAIPMEASILTNLGFDLDRVFFYFSYGVNSYGPFTGLSLLAAIFLYKVKKGFLWKNYSFFSIQFSLLSMLLVDSRGVIAIFILSLIFILLVKSFIQNKLFSIMMLMIPFLFLLNPVIDLLIMLLPSRGDFSDGENLSMRLFFWGSILDYYLTATDHQIILGNHLFFLPDNFLTYAENNDFGADASFITVHNTVLQLFIQMGLVGLLAFMIFIREFSLKFANQKNITLPNLLILAMCIFILGLGNGESLFSPSILAFPIFVLFFYSALIYKHGLK